MPEPRGTAAPRRPTFRARLTLWMTVLAVAILTAASVAIYFGARHVLRRNLDNALLTLARTEVASAMDQPGGEVHVHEERWAPIRLSVGAGYEKLAMIKRAPDTVAAQTANLASGPPLATDTARELSALAGEPSFGSMHRGADVYRGIYYPLRDGTGAPLVAIVAVPLQPVRHALEALLAVLGAALLLGALAAALAASHLARRLTRPLERIAEAAHGIGEDDLAARIPEVSNDAELHEVTHLLNAMLGRLQAALQSQRRFVADASHELRSPLTNLRGTVEVALRRPRSSEEYCATLHDGLTEIERLCRLVDDLLTLSRSDAGGMSLQRDTCDLTAIAHASVNAHALRASRQQLRLTCEAAQALPISGDVVRLRAVVDNLLDNALRYAPTGTAVTVSATRADGHAVLAVRDVGPGLTAEEQTQVFDRFYRTDSARARDSGGLGLGLAIARTVIDAHGGEIAVASTPGAGATFTITLPLALDAGQPGASHPGTGTGGA